MNRGLQQRILILGATGMLGSTLFRYASQNFGGETWGSIRSPASLRYFQQSARNRLIPNIDVSRDQDLKRLIIDLRPAVVINCIGLVKQLPIASDPISAIDINSMLPHRIAKFCTEYGARLIHISTDCVYSGIKGGYVEDDQPDAIDLYGRTKYLGEVIGLNSITLRTSIIGHELFGAHSLVDWFLSQEVQIHGYKNAIFSGFPTVELSRIILNYVIPEDKLSGLYHVSANPISKFDLLTLVSDIYNKEIKIIPDDVLKIDRSLDSTKFKLATGYLAPNWEDLIRDMHLYK